MARRDRDRLPGTPLERMHPSRTAEVIEVERSVLGALLWGTAQLNELDGLAPSDFASPRHSTIVSAMRGLRDEGGAIETSVLVERLARTGDLESAGGKAYVEELAARGGSPDVPHYARQVKAWAAERRALLALERFSAEAHGPSSRSPVERLRELATLVDSEARHACSNDSGLIVVNAASVEAKEVDWLWEPYFPRGALCLLSGLPERGKTWLALWLAACLTRGRGLLGQDGQLLADRAPERVIYVSAEDDIECTLTPRLQWLDGDLSRVDFVRGRWGPDGTILTATHEDTDALERLVEKQAASLLVLDPYSAFFGSGNMNAAPDTRLRLSRLRTLAERTRATVLILRHFRKGSAEHAISRGQGSIDATAAARAELHAGCYGDGLALTHAKKSMGEAGVSFGFRIASAPEIGPKAARLVWQGVIDATPGTIDPPDRDCGSSSSSPRGGAMAFLRDRLADGPVLVDTIRADAERAGITRATIRRAAEDLEVESRKERGRPHGPWWWCLPGQHLRGESTLNALPEVPTEEGRIKAVS